MLNSLLKHKISLAFLSLLVATLPFIVLLKNIQKNAVDVPFFDEWIFMGQILDRIEDSSLSFSEIVAPHNEHRIASTVLTYVATKGINSWNRICASYLNAYTALAGLFVYLIFSWHVFRRCGTFFCLVFILISSSLFFSSQAYENWSWGFQIQWFQLNLSVLIALSILGSRHLSILKIVIAICFGVIASLSTAGGLLLWPTGLMPIWLRTSSKSEKVSLGMIWGLSGAVVWKCYHLGLPSKNLLANVNGHFVELFETFLCLMGAPISNLNTTWAITFGVVCVVLVIFFLPIFYYLATFSKDKIVARFFRFQSSLLVFAALNLVAISLARFSFGGAQYVLDASRYTTVSALIWLSLLVAIGVIVTLTKSRKGNLTGYLVVLTIVGAGFYSSYKHSSSQWEYRHFILSEFRNSLLESSVDLIEKDPKRTDAIKRVGLFSSVTFDKLRNAKLSLFYPLRAKYSFELINSQNNSNGYIDQMISNYDNSTGKWINHVSGWAVNPIDRSLEAARVLVFYKKEVIGAPKPSQVRSDVSKTLGLSESAKVAWSYDFSSDSKVEKTDINAAVIASDRQLENLQWLAFSS